MNIFNSLGSNYDFNFVVKSLFARTDVKNLDRYLEERYLGKVLLLYKCREAIQLALKLADLPEGSFVAINGFTCFAVYEAIKKARLEVEYLDVDDSLNFSPSTLKSGLKLNPKIKAVIVQNTLGYPCQIEEISHICRKNKIILIEDLAHSVGTLYKNDQEAGTFGDFTTLSFSQDKIIDGISGGALITRNRKSHFEKNLFSVPTSQQLKGRFYPLLTFLIRSTYPIGLGKIIHQILKFFNLLPKPMDEISKELHKLPNWYCSLTKYQFERLEKDLDHRRKISAIYSKEVDQLVLSQQVIRQIPLSSNLRFPIFVKNRGNLISYLKRSGIYVSDIWYDAPIAPKKYSHLTDYKGQCKNSEKVSQEILNLPTHINISESDAKNISQFINQWLKLQ